MPCKNLVGGCFAGDRAPFAAHEADMLLAIDYLRCCVENNLTWSTVESDIRSYLSTKGEGHHFAKFTEDQIRKAQQMFLPWLDSIDAEESNVTEIR
jgi:hypothetical protein